MFLRLAGCNLDCAWCDTPYTWNWAPNPPRPELAVYNREDESHRVSPLHAVEPLTDLLVITGGEPMLQQTSIALTVERWNSTSPRAHVQIETNGTLTPKQHLPATYVVSPKIQPSAQVTVTDRHIEAIASYVDLDAHFKFVASTPTDTETIEVFCQEHRIPADRIWLMPEGTTANQLAETFPHTWDTAVANGWNLSHRLHTLAHNDRRGI